MTASGRVWFPISAGLLTWEHYQRLGPAWMVFCWMIHEQRAPKGGEPNDGAIRNGEPISYEGIGGCLQGMPARTVERHIAILEREGYIRSEYIRGHGKRYTITNPIRWSMVLPRTGESVKGDSAEVGSGHSAEMGRSTPQKCGAVLPRNGEANKEQKPKTKNKIKSEGARAPVSRATQLPEEFQPNENHRRLALKLGVDLDTCFPAFCDHHESKGNTFKDWGKALNGWLRREVDFKHGGTNGNRAQHLSDHFKSGQRLSLQNRPTEVAVRD
jgi:hypothetical protein